MSQRMPVGPAINEAAQFGVHRWGAIIRFGWLPLLAYFALIGLFAAAVFDHEAFRTLEGAEPETLSDLSEFFRVPLPAVFGLLMLTAFAAAFLFSGAMASVYRLVALGEDRPGIFQFRMDDVARRVFIGLVIQNIAVMLVWGLGCLSTLTLFGTSPGAVVAAMSELAAVVAQYPDGNVPQNAIAPFEEPLGQLFTAGILATIPVVYISIKLTPFLAGTAAENRLFLVNSLVMTFGHAWSIFFGWVMLIIFILIAGIVFAIAAQFVEVIAMFMTNAGGALAFGASVLIFGLAVVQLIFNAFLQSIQLAYQAVVYRRIKTGE